MELKAGRELDALVEEKVMELPQEHHWAMKPNAANAFCDRCGYFPGPPILASDAPACTPRPYSTDIAAAWEVVEKLRERRDTSFKLHQPVGGGYACTFIVDETRVLWPWAPTAPLAICLAALKASQKPA